MKFDIENYENMSDAEKVAALEKYEPDMSGFVSKDKADRIASELAATKKSLREKMSEDEAKKADEEKEKADLLERVRVLEREKTVSGYVASYIAMGYDEALARDSAEALADGDMAKVFANQKAHAVAAKKALKAELLKGTPVPAGGSAPAKVTREDIMKMSLSDQITFAEENPELYNEIYGGNN